jgi:hypothetical protein
MCQGIKQMLGLALLDNIKCIDSDFKAIDNYQSDIILPTFYYSMSF